jgi:hypothetical protein
VVVSIQLMFALMKAHTVRFIKLASLTSNPTNRYIVES